MEQTGIPNWGLDTKIFKRIFALGISYNNIGMDCTPLSHLLDTPVGNRVNGNPFWVLR